MRKRERGRVGCERRVRVLSDQDPDRALYAHPVLNSSEATVCIKQGRSRAAMQFMSTLPSWKVWKGGNSRTQIRIAKVKDPPCSFPVPGLLKEIEVVPPGVFTGPYPSR